MKPSIYLKNANLFLIIFLLLAINLNSASPDVVNYFSNLNQKSDGFYSTTHPSPVERSVPRRDSCGEIPNRRMRSGLPLTSHPSTPHIPPLTRARRGPGRSGYGEAGYAEAYQSPLTSYHSPVTPGEICSFFAFHGAGPPDIFRAGTHHSPITPVKIVRSSHFTGQALTIHQLQLTRLFPRFPSFSSFITSIYNGDNATFEAIFRPMEFREPIIMIPIEGRYGMGFYGTDHLNPFRFDYGLITYENDSVTVLKNNNIMGRFGHFMEINALQINPSYYLFKKSYFDIHVGLSFRYFSVMDIPTAEFGKYSISGPPEVPSSWPLKKTFAPRTVEGNILSSLILQWHPKWFLHLKYSYGMNRTRFYRGDGTSGFPYGNGTSSAYSVGIKFIRESETAARYAIGLELKYIYLKIDKIVDPNNVTPITGMQYPMFGLYLNIGVFYGGNKTIGDDGKELYLEKDYVSAAEKFQQFLRQYPHHAKRGRAEKLIEICNHRIPNQLYIEGNNFKKVGKIDKALEKYVEASKMADGDLKKRLDRDIELIAQDYISMAESLFISGETDDALRMARSAASISERGQDVLKLIGVKITIRQGEDLATHGMYAQALEKFAIALEIEPSLWIDIRWNELKVANKMLEDVNKAYDEGTLRLALESLKKSKEILGQSDEKMDRMIEELERQLKATEKYRVKQRIDEYANEARWKNILRYMPKIELGMLVAEVQDILGEPDDITQRVDNKNRNYQMWIYNLPDNRRKFLYFEDYMLFKVEEE